MGDLSPLAGLSKLTSLVLSGAQVSDLSPLAGLSKLTSLRLSGDQVSDLSPLAALCNLADLDVNSAQKADLAAVKQLSGLCLLMITQSQMDRLWPGLDTMERRTGLTVLVLDKPQIGLLGHWELVPDTMASQRFLAKNC